MHGRCPIYCNPVFVCVFASSLVTFNVLYMFQSDMKQKHGFGFLTLGGIKVVELLLENGADASWTNNKGSSLLHFLGYSPMSDRDKKAVARKLIEAGVNIDTKVRRFLGFQTL